MDENYEIDKRIEAAVRSAIEAGITDIEGKIRAAIEVGVEVGAAAAAEAAATAAAKAAERERKRLQRQQTDKRYHDTKLLIRKYRQLNEYYQNAVFDEEGAEEADEDFEEIMRSFGVSFRDEKITADSIKRNYLVTRVVMAHVNKMLEVFQTMCERSNRASDKRRWRVLHDLYLSERPSTAEQIASREKIERRTIYKDIDACLSDLSVLFFGIDGLDQVS
jgi:hypothetical protein